MKKFYAILLIISCIFIFTSCLPEKEANKASGATPNSNAGKLATAKDGKYEILQQSTKGGYEQAVVTIKDGKFENIELKRLDKNKKEVNYDQWDGTKYGHPNLKQFRLDLAKAMVGKQLANVDAIAGATESSNGWKTAVDNALGQAQ